MSVFLGITNLPHFNFPVITTGTFDGVHLGHRVILKKVADHAREVNGESILLTFEPHPRKLLFPDQPLQLLTPLSEKLQLIKETGIQHIVVVPFTEEFASMTATEYIEDFLVSVFKPHSIVIGYDHRFGHDRAGDLKLLEHYSSLHQYQLVEIPPLLIDEAAISSTKIRHAIQEGRVDDAALMLGRHLRLRGTVVHGNKLGREIGFPTANLKPTQPEQIIPGTGIYAIRTVYDHHTYDAMLSIGYNPTVTNKKELRIEANIFDFEKDIYDKQIELIFIKKIRDEIKFASLDELKEQIKCDKKLVMSVLSSN